MMRNLVNKLVATGFMLLSTQVLADSSGYHQLDRVEVGENGFNIYVKEGNFNTSTCSDGTTSTVNHVVGFSRADFPNGYDNFLSTATAAYVSGKTVSMWYSGCVASPWGNGQMPKPVTLVLK